MTRPPRLLRSDSPGALDGAYSAAPCGAGAAVHVFVIDTGVYAQGELQTRLSNVSVCVLDSTTGGCASGGGVPPWSDDFGHGTHVSGTAAGARVGASKAATVHAAKALSGSGSGTTSTVAAAANWVLNTVAATPALRLAVVSMSLGGPASSVVDSAVQSLLGAGITVVVAAGNDNADACTVSPARVPGAVTVGAADASNARAAFSNTGSCVDIFAPGVAVLSSVNATGAYAVWSGTNMATPHVTGVVALMLAAKPCLSPASVASILVATATQNALSGVPAGTANRMINGAAAVRAAAASTAC